MDELTLYKDKFVKKDTAIFKLIQRKFIENDRDIFKHIWLSKPKITDM